MEPRQILKSGITASALAHLSCLLLVIFFAEVHPFSAVTAEPIAVDIVTPEEVVEKPAEPQLPPTPKQKGKGKGQANEPAGGDFHKPRRPPENAYVIADSNHGFKMIGVGALVARELLGEQQGLLAPFRFARYSTGELHPTSHSPFPWS